MAQLPPQPPRFLAPLQEFPQSPNLAFGAPVGHNRHKKLACTALDVLIVFGVIINAMAPKAASPVSAPTPLML